MSDDSDTTTTATPAAVQASDDSEPTKTPKPKKTAAADTVKDGDYLVGREIKTGTWKTSQGPTRELVFAMPTPKPRKVTSSNKRSAQTANP
jgi:hypothetical protein